MAYLSVLTVVVPNVVNAQEPLLNLQEDGIAVQEDPWLTASKQTQRHSRVIIASSGLPDPQISLTAVVPG